MRQVCYNVLGEFWPLFRRDKRMNKYLDAQKSLEAILHVSRTTTDLFHIVKVLYFADKIHLERYGRMISWDHYVAMREGPVPSGAYDLIKYARGDRFTYDSRIAKTRPELALSVDGDVVSPAREPNPAYLSDSDLECLNEAIARYSQMNWKELWKIAHQEKAYKKTPRDRPIPLSDLIALDVPNGKEVLEYLDS
jgi:uncharacterized phage-associated protein